MAAGIGIGFDRSKRLQELAAGRAGLIVFAGTLLLSASLLFSVQPLFAKMVLPHLGGSPSVWAVAMCFFQGVLLAGYCYAHALNRYASSWAAPVIHLGVCAVALLTLPFALPEWSHDVPTGNTYFWLVGVLAVGVGLPFFATSANAPLLQAWFSRSGHPHASDPYFLYGASNLGSLVSLLAYPFVIEPTLGLDVQRSIWAAGFVILSVALAVCAMLMLSNSRAISIAEPSAAPAAAPSVAPTLEKRLTWIGLAFIPSALLVAFTTHITTDIASAPFLWVIPLATFLGTFVIVFRDRSMIPHKPVLRVHPILVAATIAFVLLPTIGGPFIKAFVGFATFVVTTLVSHRALYEARPGASRLTEFYLYMSLGGVLGGIFSALIAPQLFNSVVEYPLLVIAGLLTRPGVTAALRGFDVASRSLREFMLVAALLVVLIVVAMSGLIPLSVTLAVNAAAALSVAAVIAVLGHWPRVAAATTFIALGLILVAASSGTHSHSERSFFGVSRVETTPDGRHRLFVHGSTIHGGQRLTDDAGNALGKPEPIMYYHALGGMARGFDLARAGHVASAEPFKVGVVGLGSGALACFIKPGEELTYFEIDPVVVSIARNPKQFTFLSSCAPDAGMVVGDARLTLGKQPAGKFDYLVVDAYSSDAVPVHLLTHEAIELYFSRVSDKGLLAFHVSNRHMELLSVVAATAGQIPGVHISAVTPPKLFKGYDNHPSDVVYLSKDPDVIARAMALPDARKIHAGQTLPWSDNYADILSAIWRRYAR